MAVGRSELRDAAAVSPTGPPQPGVVIKSFLIRRLMIGRMVLVLFVLVIPMFNSRDKATRQGRALTIQTTESIVMRTRRF